MTVSIEVSNYVGQSRQVSIFYKQAETNKNDNQQI